MSHLYVECDEEYLPEVCAPGPDNPNQYPNTPGDELYIVPGDPSPGSAGLWLGATVKPANCFAWLSASVVSDGDQDWLADHCETEIAKGFAPTLRYSYIDNCAAAEPYWAARAHTTGVVRVAYMFGYYSDCGPYGSIFGIGSGHAGDSEMVTVEVHYNSSSQHWEFHRMWTSAHYEQAVMGFSGDRSRWTAASGATFSKRALAHPSVWVAIKKHANYPSSEVCNQTWTGDVCESAVVPPLRFPVLVTRNVGSMHVPMPCVGSQARFAGNGRQECFFSEARPFHGWWPNAEIVWEGPAIGGLQPGDIIPKGVMPYREMLRGPMFDQRCSEPATLGDPIICVWGPGGPLPYGAQVTGPSWGYDEYVTVQASVQSPPGGATTGLYYRWFLRTCADGPPEFNCNLSWYPIDEGYDVTTATTYLSRYDIYHKLKVEIRLGPSTPVLATSPHHQISGAGESSGCCGE